MCDNCKNEHGILRILGIAPDDRRDPLEVARRRLLCYYQCVTQDMSPDLLDDEDDDDDIWDPEE